MAGKRPVNSLLYGDVVFLHCKTGGYVFSEVSSTTSASIIVYPVSSKDENDPNFPNLKMAAFQVLAAEKVKAQQRFADIRKELLKEGKNTTNLSTEEREILLSAEKNAEIEISNNRAEQERVAGTLVLYGNTIQLLHLFSGKYVAIDPIETSKTENINVQVELTAENSECTFFKMLPRYKVKSVGHEVHLHDQVTFRVVNSTEGQYLHTSKLIYHDVGITLYGECHEVNIASVPSSYTLKPHHHAILDDECENLVKAGSIIRLFHREIECYLVAKGSFANNKEKVMIEDVHLRKRRSDNGKLRPPSTSAITYWQIEKDRSLNGNAIAWEERCRIKHLPTRMYLAVVKDENNSLKVTLKDRNLATPDLDMVFRLIPVIEEDDKIKFESYARVNHPLTNSWLSAKQSKYNKRQFDSKATGLNALQWDTADVREVGVTSEKNYDDAFTIEEVTDELVQKFNHVAEVIPVIKTYTEEGEKSTEAPIEHHNVSVVIEALDVITEFIGSAHADLIDRQKLLRNLMVIELIVQILQNYDPSSSSDSPQQMVSRACYKVLEVYLKGKSGKNDIYLVRFISLFRRHSGLGLKVENMLTEDSKEIVLGYELQDIDWIIEKLLQTKDSRFMDLLSALCVCNYRPIPEHQDYIVENLLKYTKELFYSTKVGKDPIHIHMDNSYSIYICKPQELAQDKWESIVPGSKDYQFLLAQLNLFAMLCKGNNKKANKAIDKNVVTFDEALAGVKDPKLDPSLRSKYLELIIVLYVDADDDNRVLLEDVSLSFNYSEIRKNSYKEAAEDPTVALTGAKNVHFPELRDWIKSYVASQQIVVGGKEMINHNIFSATVIDLLYLLVKYGYYGNLDDINNLMPPLLSLLNGLSDKPSIQASKKEVDNFKKDGRFKDTEENRPIFKLKVKVLKTINLFFNFRLYLRIQNFIFDYKLLKSDAQATHLLSASHSFSDSQDHYPLPPTQLTKLESNLKNVSIHKNKHLMSMAVQRLETILSLCEYDFEKLKHDAISLPSVLLDLANYENDKVLCESLHLLNRYYSSEDTLFEKALQTQLLINPDSKEVLANITNELLPALRRLVVKDVNEEQFQELISILRKLISLCHLKDAVHEPHSQNQQILYNTGVFSDIMSLIFKKQYKPKIAQDGVRKSQQEIIVSTSLQFLKLLARDHRVVQERLFYGMDRLLNLKFAIPDVAELLIEVFTGVKKICLKIEEKHIEKIFKLVVKYKGCPELLDLLQAVVKAEDIDLPLKQNQTVIVKYFNLNREKFCDSFLGKDSKKEQKRESLLLKADDSNHSLQVFLKVIDLLAACCEGENLYIESLCQNMMSISELMKILNNHEIKPDRKRPFVLFLLWAYINTGKNAKVTGCDQLTHSQEMWCYLEHINIVLGGIVRVMSSLTSAQATSVKLISNSQLRKKIISKKINTDTDHNEGSKDKVISHSSIPYVTNVNGELIPGILIYIMQGALPLIKVYYTKLFDPYKPDQSIYQKEIQVSANIASTLLHLADVMVTKDCFGSQQQWKLLSNTIITVISHDCYNEGMINVDTGIKARFNDHMQARFSDKVGYKVVIQSNTTKAYLEEYEEEKMLNENFYNFVKNFQLAYWGPNTAQHQIGSPYDTKYSDYVEGAEFHEKGDEWLPLGLKFQKHVACFVSRQQSQTTVYPVTKRVIDYLLVSYNNFNYLTEKKQRLLHLHTIKYLQVLRTIVHNEIMFIDLKLREQGHDPQKFRRQSKRVREVQNQIQNFGDRSTISKLVKLLSHSDGSISGEVLALLAILLFSGNKKIQKNFASYLLDTREEILFVSMQQRLEQGSYNESKSRVLLAELKLKHVQDQILKRLYTEYAMRYGFSKVSSIMFVQPHVSFGYIEEEPVEEPIISSREKLIISDDIELREVHSQSKKVIFSGTSRKLNRTLTARRLSLQSSIIKTESLPGIRIAEDEIQQQKIEGESDKKPVEHSKLATLKFRDTSYIQLTLRFLGLLCDRQNRVMQNYFREQRNNIKTINLVSETCAFLQSFYVEVTNENIDLITEVLLTLIEMCVGNFANQEVIYKHHIVDVINRILQTTLFHQCSLSKVLVLKSTAIKILEMMCEETNPQTKSLVGNIFKAVDIDALHASVAYFCCLSQDEEMKHSGEDINAERATFATYHILVHFADFQGISLEMIRPKLLTENTADISYKEIIRGWTLCEKQSKSIEVSYKNDDGEVTLAKVHFRAPKTTDLSDEIRQKVKINVNRTSPEDKLRDFSKWIESVKREVQHLNYLRAHWYTKIFVQKLRWQNYLLFLWTLLMNILMMIAWENTIPERRLNDTEIVVPTVPRETDNWFFSYILYIGGSIHLLMSVAIMISYFLINGSNFVLPSFVYKFFHRQHNPSYSDVPFFGLRTIYHIVFVIFSVLSLFFYGYFYCLCLFHIVVDNDILQRVLKSVTKNGKSLLWVAALGLIVIYNYAVGTFLFMPSDFDNQAEGEVTRYCSTLFECSITVLEYGLLDTIGLAVTLPRNLRDATLRAIFYDLSFFVIVTTIGLNIVFGIIVDAFTELRDEKYNIERDRKGFCFICNIPSFEFERRAKGFNYHVENEHSMWDYIKYIMYLEEIDVSDHNAIEHYVHQQINREDKNTGYFPLFQARSLQKKKNDTLTELAELKLLMSVILEHHQEEQRNAAIQRNKDDHAEWERKHQTEQIDE